MDENTSPVLELKNFVIEEFGFKRNDIKDIHNIRINPKISRRIGNSENDPNSYRLILEIVIEGEETPFNLKATIMGNFIIHNSTDLDFNTKFIAMNATAILYPYLRALVTSITANSLVPPLILPVCNIAEMFEKEETTEIKNV